MKQLEVAKLGFGHMQSGCRLESLTPVIPSHSNHFLITQISSQKIGAGGDRGQGK